MLINYNHVKFDNDDIPENHNAKVCDKPIQTD